MPVEYTNSRGIAANKDGHGAIFSSEIAYKRIQLLPASPTLAHYRVRSKAFHSQDAVWCCLPSQASTVRVVIDAVGVRYSSWPVTRRLRAGGLHTEPFMSGFFVWWHRTCDVRPVADYARGSIVWDEWIPPNAISPDSV